LGGEEGRAHDDDIRLASQAKATSFGAALKRKSEPLVVFKDRASLADVSSDEEVTRKFSAKSSKKRFVLIRTLPDGTKTKSIISPDDPILQKVLARFVNMLAVVSHLFIIFMSIPRSA